MNKYKFNFYRKGTKLATETVLAETVQEACEKAETILETSPRKYDDWELINDNKKEKK